MSSLSSPTPAPFDYHFHLSSFRCFTFIPIYLCICVSVCHVCAGVTCICESPEIGAVSTLKPEPSLQALLFILRYH